MAMFGAEAKMLVFKEPPQLPDEQTILLVLKNKLGPYADQSRLLFHIRSSRGKIHWAVNSYFRQVLSVEPVQGYEDFVCKGAAVNSITRNVAPELKVIEPTFIDENVVPNNTSNQGPSLETLPLSILEDILCRLDAGSVCSLAATCTTLRNVACIDHVWASLFMQRWGTTVFPTNSTPPITLPHSNAALWQPSAPNTSLPAEIARGMSRSIPLFAGNSAAIARRHSNPANEHLRLEVDSRLSPNYFALSLASRQGKPVSGSVPAQQLCKTANGHLSSSASTSRGTEAFNDNVTASTSHQGNTSMIPVGSPRSGSQQDYPHCSLDRLTGGTGASTSYEATSGVKSFSNPAGSSQSYVETVPCPNTLDVPSEGSGASTSCDAISDLHATQNDASKAYVHGCSHSVVPPQGNGYPHPAYLTQIAGSSTHSSLVKVIGCSAPASTAPVDASAAPDGATQVSPSPARTAPVDAYSPPAITAQVDGHSASASTSKSVGSSALAFTSQADGCWAPASYDNAHIPPLSACTMHVHDCSASASTAPSSEKRAPSSVSEHDASILSRPTGASGGLDDTVCDAGTSDHGMIGAGSQHGPWRTLYRRQVKFCHAMRCPRCGDGRLLPLVYGFPSPTLLIGRAKGRLILGGDHLIEDCHVWACAACNTCFKSYPYDNLESWLHEQDGSRGQRGSVQLPHGQMPLYTYEL